MAGDGLHRDDGTIGPVKKREAYGKQAAMAQALPANMMSDKLLHGTRRAMAYYTGTMT